MMRARLWSPNDEDVLRRLWPTASREELEDRLQRSWGAIRARALLLALPAPLVRRRRRPRGTPQQAGIAVAEDRIGPRFDSRSRT